jgi:exodeoxyribonuclease V alpha subunit
MNAAGSASAGAELAEGFARHVERWARSLGCQPAHVPWLRQAALQLSLATGEGQVCVMLTDLAATLVPAGEAATAPIHPIAVDDLRHALLGSGVVGTPASPGAMPLVLDAEGRLYLHRHFDHERRLAARLMTTAAAAPAPVDAGTRARLAEWFGPAADAAAATGTASATEAPAAPDANRAVDWQQVAAALALRRRLTVISGGPGTGKTTTVVNLLACLIAQAPECRIALAAPTGKAAARLTEAIRQRAGHLPAAIRERLPTASTTVHRLLGVRPGTSGFVHHARNPLPIDALVVDEASMLDLALAARLFDAVPPGARIVLLGDKDQLAAVEAGAVFSELCADPGLSEACRADIADLCGLDPARLLPPPPAESSPLRDSAVWLTQNFRFGNRSGIGRLATAINAARMHDVVDALRGSAVDGSVRWLDAAGAAPGPAFFETMRAGFGAYLGAIRRDPSDVDAVTAAFAEFRVLCAVRDGPRGVLAINEHATRHAREFMRARAPHAPGRSSLAVSPWFVGRPVMVMRNEPVLKLFNGDIGIALPAGAVGGGGADADADADAGADADDQAQAEAGDLRVFFPDADGGFRAIAPARLPAHETAFAMTVHKAQGSEFSAVLVVLPERRSRVVTRELLYTAVTRARREVIVCAPEDALGAAIAAPTRRRSGLIARMREWQDAHSR